MSTPPSLLFLFTDEQRADTLACYGNDAIDMPHLNRLAAQSCVFENAYVTQPVCTPSRASIMTGLYPHTNRCVRNNLVLPPEIPCLPELIPDNPYRTAYMGKWHLGDELFAQHGFDEWVSIEDMYIDQYGEGRDRAQRSDYHRFLADAGLVPDRADRNVFSRGFCARLDEALSKPRFLADRACDFIRRADDEPFILFVNFLEPHMPFYGPRDGQYPPETVTLPSTIGSPPTMDQPLVNRLIAEHLRVRGYDGLPLVTDDDWRLMIARYWGLNSLVDTHAGRILEALTAAGRQDDTIVVYTSDHGDMMGAHRMLAKSVMFEEACRVPMLIRLPGQAEQRRITGPFSQVDLVPTLLELMGAEIPAAAGLQGCCRAEACRENGGKIDTDVFIEWSPHSIAFVKEWTAPERIPDYALRLAAPEAIVGQRNASRRTVISREGWKLTLSSVGDHELYDLNTDPAETENRFGRPADAAMIADLAERIRAWQQRTADILPAMTV